MGLSGEHQVPPPKEEGEICFSSTCPVELGAQAGTAKLLSPCTQGPPWGTISSPSPNPAGVQREGRSEIRSPMEPLQGQDCRSRARRGPGDFYPMGPKSRASWQHGLPAGTATNSEALWSKGVQGEERFRRDCCLQGPKSMASWQHGLPASSDALRE